MGRADKANKRDYILNCCRHFQRETERLNVNLRLGLPSAVEQRFGIDPRVIERVWTLLKQAREHRHSRR